MNSADQWQISVSLRSLITQIVLAKHYVAIGVSVPEVVPDGTGNLAKCWSEGRI